MQEVFQKWVIGMVRYGLVGVSVWFVNQGILSPDDIEKLAVGIGGLVAMAAWLWMVKQGDRVQILTALAQPAGTTEASLNAKVKAGETVPVSTPSNVPPVVPALFLILSLGGLAGCGGVDPIGSVPPVVNAATQDVRAGAGKALGILKSAARVANTISIIEDQASKDCVTPATATAPASNCTVPANIDQAFDQIMVAYTNVSDAAVKNIMTGVTTWDQLRAQVDPVLAEADRLLKIIQSFGALKTRAGQWVENLKGILSDAAGEFVFGGAR